MEGEISRRSFLKKSAIAVGAVAVFDFTSMGSADQVSGINTLSSEKLREETMPHVIVKLWLGRSEQQKIQLAEEIVKDVADIMECGEESVSVAIEEVDPKTWKEKVYDPLIRRKMDTLYKKPGYSM
jgi:4-oxalocrotonate tautomerase